MKKYECEPCGYIYDPAVGDPDGSLLELLSKIFLMTGYALSAEWEKKFLYR